MVLPLSKAPHGYLRLTYSGPVGDLATQSWDLTPFPASVRSDPDFKANLLLFVTGSAGLTAVDAAVSFFPAVGTPTQLILTFTAADVGDTITLDVWELASIIGAVVDGPKLYFIGGGGGGGTNSGVYTPTITPNLNIQSTIVPGTFKWSQVGNIVTVAGQVLVDPVAALTQTDISISLPLPAVFVDNYQAQGIGMIAAAFASGMFLSIQMSGTGDKIDVDSASVGDASLRAWHVMFSYSLV